MVARDKGYRVPQPIVLGHEGAGIVESVGADVLKVAPGDSVVLTFLTCGRCKPCRLGSDGTLREDVPALLRWNAVGRQHCYTRRPRREGSRSLFRAIVVGGKGNSIVTDHKSRFLPQAMSFPAPTSDLNRAAVYEQLDTSHIAAFVRSQKNSSFGNLF
jgi:Alcohol dehydrogenase GroES-like domain